jgi:ABC-type branched-subunit amino acid transport system substrate-binding protein
MAMGAGEQRKLGGDAAGLALSMVVPNTRRVDLAVVRDYQEAMRAIGVHEFSAHSLEGYVNARVLVEGLERTGKDLSRAKLRTALAGIHHHDLGGMAVDFGNGAPYLGSRLVALGILNTSGHVIE